MRREFILVLLGIICISTLSSLLSGYVQIESDKLLLDTVVGSVGAGNFSYWQLGHAGPLLVELTSLSGDADLYIADHIRPSYEIDMNNFSSATCGYDVVNIPTDFPRPIGGKQTYSPPDGKQLLKPIDACDTIGVTHALPTFSGIAVPAVLGIAVFGYWSNTVSDYSIQIFLDLSASQAQAVNIERSHRSNAERHVDVDKRREKAVTRKSDDAPKLGILNMILNILDMAFETFVL